MFSFARHTKSGWLVLISLKKDRVEAISETDSRRLNTCLDVLQMLDDSRDEERRIQARSRSILLGLRELIDSDPAHPNHHQHTLSIGRRICRAAGISEDEQRQVEEALEFHDIGALPIGLDGDEVASVFLHPAVGASLIKSFGASDRVCELVASHHERIDGLGYPEGKAIKTDRLAWILILSEAVQELREGDESKRQLPLSQLVQHFKSKGLVPDGFIEEVSRGLERSK